MIKRYFLGSAVVLLILSVSKARSQDNVAKPHVDSPAIHNMLIVGKNTVFLSHLPMFQEKGGEPMPHRYQAIFEVTFTAAGFDPQLQFAKDRETHRGTKVYTLGPEEKFPLPSLKDGKVSSFGATVFRGHLEKLQDEKAFQTDQAKGEGPILSNVKVNLTRVVHFREFDPKAKKPSELEYILFGRGEELFLAHRIVHAPDFDQILAVKMPNHHFSDEQLAAGVPVAIPKSLNSAATRLKEKQQSAAEILPGTRGSEMTQVAVDTELYFEDGELQLPPIFQQTPEEKLAGFP